MKSEEESIWESYEPKFKYFRNHEECLLESPNRIGDGSNLNVGKDLYSEYEFIRDSNNGYKFIRDINFNNDQISIYIKMEDNFCDLRLLSDKLGMELGYIHYIERDINKIEIETIYNQPLFKGLIYHTVFDFLLEKYSTIISGGLHSTQGESFWGRVLKFGFDNREQFDLMVINVSNGESKSLNSVIEMSQFYGSVRDGRGFDKYRFVIQKM